MEVNVAQKTSTGDDSIAALKLRVRGQVVAPADPQYETARLGWNLAIDQRPALIVFAESSQDVAEAVLFARRQGLGIAVQSTGHGLALGANNALLINTSRLKALRINAAEQTAWVGAGLKWGEVLAEAQKHGLAPLLGSSPDVGVVGYSLGGGLGWLGRKYGLSTDSVLAIELVSAEGRLLRASAIEEPELFWGMRGGGGGFGVVTGMEIRLYPVEMVYGGNLFYPASLAREAMQRYCEWIRSAPDALTTSVVVINFPPVPQLPEMLRGSSFVIVRGCYAGPLEEGEALMKYWRDWKAPLIDDFKAMPFSDAAKISSAPVDPMPSKTTGAWMRELTDEAIDALLRHTLPQAGSPPASSGGNGRPAGPTASSGGNGQPAGPTPIIFSEVRHTGGAIARVPRESAAFSHRDAELLLCCVGAAPTPEAYARLGALTDQMKAEMGSALTGGVYMNFLSGAEVRRRTKDGYHPEVFQRLRALKARMDPDNLFRFGFDVTPE